MQTPTNNTIQSAILVQKEVQMLFDTIDPVVIFSSLGKLIAQSMASPMLIEELNGTSNIPVVLDGVLDTLEKCNVALAVHHEP